MRLEPTNSGSLRWFILEDEAYTDAGYDNPPRSTLLKILGRHNLTVALSSDEAKLKFDPRACYTHMIIDFDMHGFPNPDLTFPNTGLNFIQWMVARHKLLIPTPEIFLHSQNVRGREAMAKLLKVSGYKKVSQHYFGRDYLAMLSERFL